MFLQLNHKKLEVYQVVSELLKEVYYLSIQLPKDEKYNMVQQVRRAVLSIKLNLAEGSSKRSTTERKRYLEIARGSIVELDAAFETAIDLNFYTLERLDRFSMLLNKCFAMLSRMIVSNSSNQ